MPLATTLPVYEEVTGEGDHGLLFGARDAETLGAQLARLIADPALREGLRAAAAPVREHLAFTRLAGELEGVYAALAARRHDPAGKPAVGRRLAGRRSIDVDLHMHTDHSMDCATPVEVLLATARDQGLGAIAVTDHNEISGALEAQRMAPKYGVKVIVGEEVKTKAQGEVIGLFLTEKIPRGMTLQETVAEIKRQGGIVYVPHPFDRMHAVPDYEHLLGSSTTSTRSRSTTRAWRSAPSTRRLSASPRSTGSSRAPGRTPTSRPGWAPSASGCRTSTGPRSSSRRCGSPRSTPSQARCSTCRR